MSFSISCPFCHRSLKVPPKALGRSASCPACGNRIQIPDAAPEELPPLEDFLLMKETAPTTSAAPQPRANKADNDFQNYSQYEAFTKARQWHEICWLNSVDFENFGTKKEVGVLPKYLEPSEVVFALTNGLMRQTSTSNSTDIGINTWLVVLTSERFLFLDHALLTKSVDSQSIRHDRVQAVTASQGWLMGKIGVDIGSRTVVIDNCPKATVVPIAQLANKWLGVLQKRRDAASGQRSGGGATSVADEIKKLADLYSHGLLTQAEFSAAKARLLASM